MFLSSFLFQQENHLLSFFDLHPQVRNFVMLFQQDDWSAVRKNKLLTIKPSVHRRPSSNYSPSRHSRLLTRVKIGHIFISYTVLFLTPAAAFREDCIVPLTVKHDLSNALLWLLVAEGITQPLLFLLLMKLPEKCWLIIRLFPLLSLL